MALTLSVARTAEALLAHTTSLKLLSSSGAQRFQSNTRPRASTHIVHQLDALQRCVIPSPATGAYDSNIEMRESNKMGLPKTSSTASFGSRQTSSAAEEMGGDTFDLEGDLKFNTQMNAGQTRERASSSFVGIRESFIKATQTAKVGQKYNELGAFSPRVTHDHLLLVTFLLAG